MSVESKQDVLARYLGKQQSGGLEELNPGLGYRFLTKTDWVNYALRYHSASTICEEILGELAEIDRDFFDQEFINSNEWLQTGKKRILKCELLDKFIDQHGQILNNDYGDVSEDLLITCEQVCGKPGTKEFKKGILMARLDKIIRDKANERNTGRMRIKYASYVLCWLATVLHFLYLKGRGDWARCIKFYAFPMLFDYMDERGYDDTLTPPGNPSMLDEETELTTMFPNKVRQLKEGDVAPFWHIPWAEEDKVERMQDEIWFGVRALQVAILIMGYWTFLLVNSDRLGLD